MQPYSREEYGQFMKRKLKTTRLMGLFTCIVGLTCMILFGFQKSNLIETLFSDWMLLIMLTYTMAAAFTLNSGLQGVRTGNPWSRLNAIFAIVFYLFVVTLISYGFATGNLEVNF